MANKSTILIQLAKPNQDIIGELLDVKSPQSNLKLGLINKLTLTIPYYVERNHKRVKNPNFDNVKEKYQLKISTMDTENWYVIDKVRKSGGDGKSKEIECYTLGYELSGDKIYNWAGVLVNGEYRKESLTIDQVSSNILSSTVWSVDYIDPDLLGVYRAFDFQNVTPLQSLYQIAETFNAIIVWDTLNRQIDFYHTKNYGTNKGLYLDYVRYLKTIEDEIDSQEIITRIKPYGKDGLTINDVNPTGENYIQDFSYYYGHFSDSLKNALISYDDLVTSKETEYQSLINDMVSYQSQIVTKQNAIDDKELQLIQVQDTIQLKQTQGQDASAELTQESQLKSDISTLQSDLNTLQTNLDNTLTSMQNIHDQLSMDNNFTQAQLNELSPFINTEIWENQNYTDSQDLRDATKERLSENSKPKSKLRISLVDLLAIAEAKEDVKKLVLGDKLYIYYPDLGIDVESQIIEMSINHETGSVDLVIANTKNINRDDDEWLSKLLYQNATTYGSVIQNQHKWNDIDKVKNDVTELMKSKQSAAKREIVAGVNESVTINNQGITITDSNDPLRFIRQTNSVIGLTGDGGNTFRTAITPDGITAEEVIGRLIAGVNLTIENDSGDYTIDNDGFNITASNNRVSLNAIDGITISKNVNGSWIDKFYTDINGVINGEGLIIRDDNGNILINADTGVFNLDNMIVNGTLSADNIDATNLSVYAANIMGQLTASQINTTGLTAEKLDVSTTNAAIDIPTASMSYNGSIIDIPFLQFTQDTNHAMFMLKPTGFEVSFPTEFNFTNSPVKIQGVQVATMGDLVYKFG